MSGSPPQPGLEESTAVVKVFVFRNWQSLVEGAGRGWCSGALGRKEKPNGDHQATGVGLFKKKKFWAKKMFGICLTHTWSPKMDAL